jgi:hypothetical protein
MLVRVTGTKSYSMLDLNLFAMPVDPGESAQSMSALINSGIYPYLFLVTIPRKMYRFDFLATYYEYTIFALKVLVMPIYACYVLYNSIAI